MISDNARIIIKWSVYNVLHYFCFLKIGRATYSAHTTYKFTEHHDVAIAVPSSDSAYTQFKP
jgi:hypothetical protein